MNKLGNTSFKIRDLQILMDKDIFVPVRALNDLRREAVIHLEEERIRENGFSCQRHMEEESVYCSSMDPLSGKGIHEKLRHRNRYPEMLDVYVSTKEQFYALSEQLDIKKRQSLPILPDLSGLCITGWKRYFFRCTGAMGWQTVSCRSLCHPGA